LKFFWSDRDGKAPPPNCTFHIKPFASGNGYSFSAKQTVLPPPLSYKVLKQTYLPTRDMWIASVEKALQLIQKKELEKVVLARTCTLELEKEPDPFAIAAALKGKAQGAFVFCVQSDTEAFLGASPERLFTRKERQLLSEAIAGTRRRGTTTAEDEQLKNELLNSPKDFRELSPVQAYLKTALRPLCTSFPSFSPISIHQTQNVQHLYSKCSGILREGATDEQILMSLHPTPALCGTPKNKAYSVIKELEPFERGHYGGAIGWTTPEASEWIVGIRSCLIRGKTATLYSGTGIVEGSDPEEEWDELNQKLKLYESIFTV